MPRPPQREFVVPVMIGDERKVTVLARSADEAERRVRGGKYVRLGPSLSRGFLTVGKPEERKP